MSVFARNCPATGNSLEGALFEASAPLPIGPVPYAICKNRAAASRATRRPRARADTAGGCGGPTRREFGRGPMDRPVRDLQKSSGGHSRGTAATRQSRLAFTRRGPTALARIHFS
jgi:hypothetical protein